jgi:scyllo-inositol 2-dehydrogenase (NADP+)
MVRAGILGFGVAGRYFHAPLLQAAHIEIAAVVSTQYEPIRSDLPNADILLTPEELFARSDIDLVVIATPNHLHDQQAGAAMKAGKHVVIDKPMCTKTSQADALIDLARQRNLMLTVFQNRRWDSDFLTIEKLLAEDRMGTLTAFHARWDRCRPTVADRWREHDHPGNGVLYDLGAHLIDQAVMLFGMPDWIQADVFAQRRPAGSDDGFSIQMAAGIARITLGVSSLIADGGPRYGIHGMKGSYLKYGLDVQETQLRTGMSPTDPAFGNEPESQWGSFTDSVSNVAEIIPSERGRWLEFYEQVRACIDTGVAAPVSAASGRNVIHLIEAAIASSRSGQRVMLKD